MNEISLKISQNGVVPVIKLNHPERDSAPLAEGPLSPAAYPWQRLLFGGGRELCEATRNK